LICGAPRADVMQKAGKIHSVARNLLRIRFRFSPVDGEA
jgi:hypothetical protein